MTAPYETVRQTARYDPREAVAQGILRAFIIGYWLPCVAVDAFILGRGGGMEAAAQVFWLLFYEVIGFLAIWFVFALTRGVLLGASGEHARKRRRKRH